MSAILRIFLAGLLITPFAQAKVQPRTKNFFALDAGIYLPSLEQRFSAPTGYKNSTGPLSGFLRLRRGFHLGKQYFLEPSLGVLLPWRTSYDGSSKTFTTQFDLDLTLPVFVFLRARTGPGLQWQLFVPSGETVRLNNGTDYSYFFTPAKAVSTWVLTWLVGFEVRFSSSFSLNLDAIVLDLASRQRRNYEGVVSVGVVL
ncbi:MAG: hypothetical protein HY537_09900 [Deltaproteobacteria bacterium]|nr:hypothetical protein [Deltaproteobacteria bacterium]